LGDIFVEQDPTGVKDKNLVSDLDSLITDPDPEYRSGLRVLMTKNVGKNLQLEKI
jgi:hypothetical protein